MNRTSRNLAITLTLGIALGAVGSHLVEAQEASEKRTVLVVTDLTGTNGYELRMWRTDLGPGVAGAKHYHPGTECIYVLEGTLNLMEGETSTDLKAGDAHCVPPKTILVPRNATDTQPYKSLAVMVSPKGEPIAVPVK